MKHSLPVPGTNDNKLPTTALIERAVRAALREDRARQDITSRWLFPPDLRADASIVVRSPAVVCGLDCARAAFTLSDPFATFNPLVADGCRIRAGTVIARVHGRARTLLSAERTALNFLGRLSGIATLTRAHADRVRGTRAVVLDTRKTTPGLRALERMAVRAGGGINHRFDLASMVLVKDNHRALAGHAPLSVLVQRLRSRTSLPVMVEVDTLGQLASLAATPPDIVLLDNMTPAQLRQAVTHVRTWPRRHRPLLEASGGVTLANIRAIAAAGVDRISVGALTHSAPAIDIALDITPETS